MCSASASPEVASPLATPTATKRILDAFGLSAKYSLGQNFLVNDAVIRKILALADVNPNDRILEVGPGIGTLTIALLRRAASVISIEQDTDLYPVLAQTLADHANTWALIKGDATKVTLDNLVQAADSPSQLPNKFVANLPYAVATALVLDYFRTFDFLESATVMVQKEVADRMSAKIGTKDYGAYSVKLSLFAQCESRFAVGPNNFMPAPRVESSVIRLNRVVSYCDGDLASSTSTSVAGYSTSGAVSANSASASSTLSGVAGSSRPLTPDELQAVCMMADAGFATRRKTLMNSCKSYFAGRSQNIQGRPVDTAQWLSAVFEESGIDPSRRAETLTKEEFIALGLAAYRI